MARAHLALLLLAVPASVLAQDAVELRAVRYAQDGVSTPSVTFDIHMTGSIDASLSCGGRVFRLSKSVAPGESHTIELAGLPRGAHPCSGRLDVRGADGSTGSMPLAFGVEVLPPLMLNVRHEELDLTTRTLTVHGSRTLTKVSVDVFGERGVHLGHGETAGSGDAIALEWSQTEGEVVKMQVTAWDEHEGSSGLELIPWSYDIPHEDVVFETNLAVIRPGEVPKLDSAWTDLLRVREKYGDVIEVRLYVGGYTDTVGTPGANAGLSWRRAEAIARWFRQKGFAGPVYYQGFGETALAVATPDETDEAANRRALYILAAQAPPLSADIPAAAWKRL